MDEEQMKQREEVHEGEQRYASFAKKEYSHIMGQRSDDSH